MFGNFGKMGDAFGRFGNKTPIGLSYDIHAQAYFDGMTDEPSTAYKDVYNDFFVGLKTDSLWDKAIAFFIHASHHEQAARVDGKTPSNVAVLSATAPVFTAKEGFKGNGVDADIDYGIAGSDDLTPTDCSLACFIRQRDTVGRTAVIGNVRARIEHGLTSSVGLLFTSGSSSTVGIADNQFMAITRTGTTQSLYKDGAHQTTRTVANINSNASIHGLSRGATFSRAQISFSWMGQHLDATDNTNLNTRVNTLITDIGAI